MRSMVIAALLVLQVLFAGNAAHARTGIAVQAAHPIQAGPDRAATLPVLNAKRAAVRPGATPVRYSVRPGAETAAATSRPSGVRLPFLQSISHHGYGCGACRRSCVIDYKRECYESRNWCRKQFTLCMRGCWYDYCR